MATLLHLSDLHLSSDEAWKNFDAVKLAVLENLEEKPSLIIVSGDFLDHPVDGAIATIGLVIRKLLRRPPVRTLEVVRTHLEELGRACGPACKIAVVPGNHDVRNFGLIASRPLLRSFEQIFPDWQQPKELEVDGRLVTVFCLDSNTNDARINAARGRVGYNELLRFKRDVAAFRKKHGERYERAIKIVVLHHHPLPIAESENTHYFARDGFLGLDDAGIFLKDMADAGVDLVLHGHKHYNFSSRIEIDTPTAKGGLAIVAAGSACATGPGVKSFNVVELTERELSVAVWRRKFGANFTPETTVPVISYERFLERRFKEFLNASNATYATEKLIISYSIGAAGDCDMFNQFVGLRPIRGALAQIQIVRKSPAGSYSNFLWELERGTPSLSTFVRDPTSSLGEISGLVVFNPPLRSGNRPISCTETCRLFNGVSLTKQHRIRVANEETENMVSRVKNPTGELTLVVRFAEVELPTSIRCVVWKDDDVPPAERTDRLELERCKSHLHVCRLTKTVRLVVQKPLQGLRYGVEWDLPDGPQRRARIVDSGRCRKIRQKLLGLPTSDLNKNLFHPLFVGEKTRLEREYNIPEGQMEIGLMVYDEDMKKLRYVAGALNQDSWRYYLHDGQGVAGRAHKLESTMVYVRQQVRPEDNFAALSFAPQPELICCIPLRYPTWIPDEEGGMGETVAVITISTDDATSDFFRVADIPALAEAITLEYQRLFITDIFPMLKMQWRNNGKEG